MTDPGMQKFLTDWKSRWENAQSRLIETITNLGGISPEDAVLVFNAYQLQGWIKFDGSSRMTVRHGGLLDRETIRTALHNLRNPQ